MGQDNILIIEDSKESLKLLSDMLVAQGYVVRTAQNGMRALNSVAAKLPDLILLDIRMPIMDGFEVLRQLKAQEHSKNIPVIILSAVTETESHLEALKLGAVDFLTKPYHREELLAKVNTHVELVRAHHALERMTLDLQQANEQLQAALSDEQKQARLALEKSEARYRALAENSPLAIIISVGVEQKTVYANPTFTQLFGYTIEDIPTVEQWWPLAYPDQYYRSQIQQEWHQNILQSIETLSDIEPIDSIVTCKDGSIKFVQWRFKPSNDENWVFGFDLTERKFVEAELRKSEERFRALADTSPLAIAVSKGIEQRFTYLNPTFVDFFGYAIDEIPTVKEWWPLAYPDEVYRNQIESEWQRRVAQAIRTQSEINPIETVVTCKDGSKKHITWGFKAIGNENWAFGLDMTERKFAETELRKSEERFKALTDNSPLAIIVSHGIEQNVSYINPTFVKLFGYTLDEMPSVSYWWPLAYPDKNYRHQIEDEWQRRVKRAIETNTEIVLIESTVRCKDGSNKNILWGFKTLENENLVFGLDLTERKHAEAQLQKEQKALQESEALFKAIAESSPMAIRVTEGSNLKVTYENPAFIKTFGYTMKDIPTVSEWWPHAYPDADYRNWAITEWQRRIARSIETNTPFELTDTVVTCKDGSTKDITWGISLLGDKSLVYGIDFTERKQTEAQLREYTQQLERLSKVALEAQENERRRLAIELHDELGQALTAIKINLQAHGRFTHQTPEELNIENIRIVDDALQQVRRLALALRPSMLDDLGLVPALSWLTEQTESRTDLAITFQMSNLPSRFAPEIETACFRIVQEALTNIVRHANAQQVELSLTHDASVLLLYVQDDGCGFDPDLARKHAMGGNSMGLLGMLERATLVGGTLEIQSAPGKGCRISLNCPLRTRGTT